MKRPHCRLTSLKVVAIPEERRIQHDEKGTKKQTN